MKFAPNTSISHYTILSEIGKGGMGEVYLAQDTKLDRKVAIKFLSDEFSKDTDKLNRFVQEAKAASSLNHPNILTIHEIGDAGDLHFIATEFIKGRTLRTYLDADKSPIDKKLKIAIQIGEALSAAHKAGIVHRDIKPENIMVRDDGYVKILDFGLAKLSVNANPESDPDEKTRKLVETSPGTVMGTAKYMSPEQARGSDIDFRSDIFSFGIVIFEMFAGRGPFTGGSVMDVVASILREEPALLSEISAGAPLELENICKRALRKKRSERYQSIDELLDELKACRTEEPPETDEKTVVMARASSDLSKESFPNIEKDSLLLADFTNHTGDEIFDKTLKLALGISLAQSPSIDIFADNRVQETLRMMGREADETLSAELGREVCRREGLKVFISGTIANLGKIYMLTLEAVSAKTGETIARRLEQADSKESVLDALGKAATGLRKELGESLSSIEEYDVPLMRATTPSLEALKVFTFGVQQHVKGNTIEALSCFRKAVETDPEFAYAHGASAVMHQALRQPKLAAESATRAYRLRDRSSNLEKLRISYFYHQMVEGDIEKSLESLKLYKRTYPRDERPLINLCYVYSMIGQFEKALEAAEASVHLNPNHIIGQGNLVDTLIYLNRFDEAKKQYEKIAMMKLDKEAIVRGLIYKIAFVESDNAALNQTIAASSGDKDEYVALDWQARSSAFAGQIKKSIEFSDRSIKLAKTNGGNALAAQYMVERSLRTILLSLSDKNEQDVGVAQERISAALKLERNSTVLSISALQLAFIGDPKTALRFVDELKNEYPNDFVVHQIWRPCIEAAIFLQKNDAANAVKTLENVERFEAAAEFVPQYIRGLAYLTLDQKDKATNEFQKIIDHRGEAPLSVIYPLSQFALAKASGKKDDYQRVFEMWMNADADSAPMQHAKEEYAMIT